MLGIGLVFLLVSWGWVLEVCLFGFFGGIYFDFMD